jgi:hypothetical protein
VGEPHRSRSFEYENLAVEYSHRGLQLLTYLNGGALVAIPTALAFFKADVGRSDLLLTAGAFIVGLVFVVLAQVAAFFRWQSERRLPCSILPNNFKGSLRFNIPIKHLNFLSG